MHSSSSGGRHGEPAEPSASTPPSVQPMTPPNLLKIGSGKIGCGVGAGAHAARIGITSAAQIVFELAMRGVLLVKLHGDVTRVQRRLI